MLRQAASVEEPRVAVAQPARAVLRRESPSVQQRAAVGWERWTQGTFRRLLRPCTKRAPAGRMRGGGLFGSGPPAACQPRRRRAPTVARVEGTNERRWRWRQCPGGPQRCEPRIQRPAGPPLPSYCCKVHSHGRHVGARLSLKKKRPFSAFFSASRRLERSLHLQGSSQLRVSPLH